MKNITAHQDQLEKVSETEDQKKQSTAAMSNIANTHNYTKLGEDESMVIP
jgi:hypothetical protein|tara:strand:- start:535 stop:684 length:150 start_codon:yes stop_codon:yes gene_type:complete